MAEPAAVESPPWEADYQRPEEPGPKPWEDFEEPVQKEPDTEKLVQIFNQNVAKKTAEAEVNVAAKADGIQPQDDKTLAKDTAPKQIEYADGYWDALESGWDISVTGLGLKAAGQNNVDVQLQQNPAMFMRIASQVGTLAGDVPAMVAGAWAGAVGGAYVGGATGAAVGSVVPGAGTAAGGAVGAAAGGVVGSGAGAFALPEAIRTWMMEGFEKGEIKSFSDFWERASVTFINGTKAGLIGGATAGVGGVVGKVAVGAALPTAVKTSAQLATEVATAVSVGSALEGKMPEPHDFVDAAIVVGGLKVSTGIAGKLRTVYAKSGVAPAEVALKAETDPIIKQKALAVNAPGEALDAVVNGKTFKNPEPPEVIVQSKVKPQVELVPETTAEVQKILSKIGEVKSSTSGVTTEVVKETAHKAYTDLVDKFHPINQATEILKANKEFLPADQNPYILSRQAVDAKAKAKHFFENGTLDFKTKEVKGQSLTSTLEKVENLDEFKAYLISKRVIEKNAQGKVTGFDVESANAVVKQSSKKYEKLSKEINQFQSDVLKYVEDAGILSAESVANMKALNQDYIPFKRIRETVEGASEMSAGKAGALKKFKGSELSIQDPITSIVENTVELLQMAENNRPKAALVDLANKTEGQTLIEKVKEPTRPVKVSSEIVEKALREQGFDSADIPALEPLIAFTKVSKSLAPDEFQVYRNGKREVYKTTDPALAEAIQRLDGDVASQNALFKLANGVTRLKKFGITFTPDFILRNAMRDMMSSAVFTKSWAFHPIEMVQAMGDIVKKNDNYYRWLRSGGANGAFLDLTNNYITKNVTKLQNETNFMGSVRNLVSKPVDFMRVAAELSEQAPRLAEFKKVSKGAAGGEQLTEAGFAAREITLDFQRVGAKVSALNSITAFMNVSIQGLDKTARAFKDNPKATTAKSLAYLTVPSLLLWAAQKDDPRYQEIPRWQKDLFWIVLTKDQVYRIPKPMELGIVFGSLPERVAESYFTDNPNGFKDFQKTLFEGITPSVLPDVATPVIEQYFNKSFFTGNDIVPHHLKDVFPEYQFVEYTSESAKTLGKFVSHFDKNASLASPLVLENYIRSWGGSLGSYALQTTDLMLEKAGVFPEDIGPSNTLSDIPFIKAFAVRFPSAQATSIQDFYDNYDKTNRVMKTIKHLAKEGDFENLQKELALEENRENFIKLDGIKQGISNQREFIKKIYKMPDMDRDEKRQLIDSIYLQMIETAKFGNLLMEEVRKSTGE